MDQSAKALIQKMAGLNPVKAFKHHMHKAVAKGAAGGLAVGVAAGAGAHHLASKKKDSESDKKASSNMRSIIDDLIKGAENNTFGRPVNIQTQTDFSPIDMAKVAGAVVALSEKGYSVKQAAEYLGLTEKQIQDIVSTVG